MLMSARRQSPAEEEKWVPGKVVEYVYDQVKSQNSSKYVRADVTARRYPQLPHCDRFRRTRISAIQAA